MGFFNKLKKLKPLSSPNFLTTFYHSNQLKSRQLELTLELQGSGACFVPGLTDCFISIGVATKPDHTGSGMGAFKYCCPLHLSLLVRITKNIS
jgi:hypothetical protein